MVAEMWSDVRYRMRAMFRRGAVERALDDELRFHLQCEAEKLMREGVPAQEAMRRARVAFGGVESVKQESRDGRGLLWLETAARNLRHAGRALRRNRGLTAGVVLTLGLGIGANAAMFGIVDRLLFRPPAYLREPGQVHRIYLSATVQGTRNTAASTQYTRYLDLRRGSTSFSRMAGFSTRPLPVGIGTEAREMTVSAVSASLFDFFAARPVVGRFFTDAEDQVPLGAMVAVLGYGYWQTHFGGREDALDQPLRIGTGTYTVIGVAPKHFVGIADEAAPVAFIPITAYAGTFRAGPNVSNYYTRYNWGWMHILARRKSGVSVEAAEADLSRAFVQSWNNEKTFYPDLPPAAEAQPRAIAGPVQRERGPNQSTVTKVAGWVGGVAAIVLLIACANVANLLLARSIRRRREIGLRLALGVGRRRLVMQLLTESLLLSGLGGVAGLLLGHWGETLLWKLLVPEADISTSLADGRTLAFALAVAVLAGTLTGLAPVFQARRTDLVETLKDGVRQAGSRRSRVRTALLLLQGALSVVLLVGAGLFVQSLRNVRALRLGYDVAPVLYIYPNLRSAKLDDGEREALARRLAEAARAVPGVERAALGLTVPFWDIWSEGFSVPGIDAVEKLGSFTLQAGSPEYFATVGTRIVKGRGIGAEDRKGAPPVVVVTRAMASALWPKQDALGQCLHFEKPTAPCTKVVGIAEDIKQDSLTDDPGFHYYLPIEQFHPESAVVFARVRGDADDFREAVRRQLQPLMPGDGYLTVSSMREIVAPKVRSWQLGATMFLAFGGLALALAAIGLYSVIAYDVAQRTRELAIRIALGAGRRDIMRLVVGDGLRIALLGIALGGILALWAGRFLEPLLFDQSPWDPLVYTAVTAILLAAAALASALPAFRATQVSPNLATE